VPREGPALLQGRVVCGLCGSRMHVQYNVRRGGELVTQYVCWGRGRGYADPMCQSILGTGIDAAVGALLVATVTPVALELTLAVQQEIRARLDEADRLRHRQVERAQYEAELARQRHLHVDPANHLVADTLEADWNAALRAVVAAQEEYDRQRTTDRLVVDAEEQQRILALATDFPAVWQDPNTPARERMRMLGLLIEDVTLVKQRQVTAQVRFRGGATTTLTLPRPLSAQQQRATHEDMRQQIDALLDEYSDARVAAILNERGLRTGAGEPFNPMRVRWVRAATRLKSLKERLLAAGWVTGRHMQAQLGVRRSTLGRRRRDGRLQARICIALGEWLYWPRATPPPQPTPAEPTPATSVEDTSTARGAV
jgi:hypothetical protein